MPYMIVNLKPKVRIISALIVIISVIVLGAVLSITNHTKTAAALSGVDWKAGRIIDDVIFYDNTSMSVGDIQYFLNSKVATCDTNGTQRNSTDPSMTNAQYAASRGWAGPPYVCLKDYMQVPRSDTIVDNFSGSIPPGSISSAQIIKNAADSWHINPKALLVTLQKESLNLIYDTWPVQYQYKNAMGYGCPDTAPCDPTYAGFYNQINNAAYQFNLYRTNSNSYRYKPYQDNTIYYNPNTACGASTVAVQSYASAGLYNYTPYQPNQAALNNLYGSGDGCSAYGNRNFWRLYNDWFGPTTGTKIIKKDGDSVFYVYSQGKKTPIPSYELFNAYGFDKIGVTTVSLAYFDSLPTTTPLTRLSRYSDGTVQLIDNGYRYTITSMDSCTNWGYSCADPNVVNTLDSDLFITKWMGPLQPLMYTAGSINKMDSGKKLPFLNMQAIAENGYNPGQVSVVSDINAGQPLGALLPNDGVSISLNNGGIITYTKGQYIGVANPDLFYRWGLDKNYYKTSPSSSWDTQPPAATSTLTDYYISFGNTKLLLDGGRKIDLSTSFNNWPTAATANPYAGNLLDRLPLVVTNPQTCFQSSNGDIFVVENSQRRSIRLIDDMYRLGCRPDTLVRVNEASLTMLSAGPAKLTQNRLFKKAGEAGIYMNTGDSSSVPISSFDYITAFGQQDSDIAVVDTATLVKYSPQGSVSSLAGNSSFGVYFLYTPSGVRYYFSDDTFKAWGINKQTTPTYDDKIGSRDTSRPVTLFARTKNGAIYYGSGGSRHLITSYDAFVRLGGQPSNTMNVIDDFISAVPTGSDIN